MRTTWVPGPRHQRRWESLLRPFAANSYAGQHRAQIPGADALSGEARDVSIGGAQVWLAKRLPRFKQADVFMVIEGMIFRARAEIAGVELERNREVKGGYYRHSLRWVVMEAHAKEALSKVVPTS